MSERDRVGAQERLPSVHRLQRDAAVEGDVCAEIGGDGHAEHVAVKTACTCQIGDREQGADIFHNLKTPIVKMLLSA